MRSRKTKEGGSKTRKTSRTPVTGVRLTPAMKDALDEVAFEWQTTRAAVVRELIEHALKSHPRRAR